MNPTTTTTSPNLVSEACRLRMRGFSDKFMNKMLESLYNSSRKIPTLPQLPKALSSTMPTFDGKSEKFEHFEDLFQTSLTVDTVISEQEKIHYFQSLLRSLSQTIRNMTEATKTNLNDIKSGFRRCCVKTQSVATGRCKWETLTFDPTSQTFQEFFGCGHSYHHLRNCRKEKPTETRGYRSLPPRHYQTSAKHAGS